MAMTDDDIRQMRERMQPTHLPHIERMPATERTIVRACFSDRYTLMEEVERLRYENASLRSQLESSSENVSEYFRRFNEARDIIKDIGSYAEEALGTDGGHHKQFYLQRIACFAGLSSEAREQYDKGIAP